MNIRHLVLTSGKAAITFVVDSGLPEEKYLQVGPHVNEYLMRHDIKRARVVVLPNEDELAATIEAYRTMAVAQFNDNELVIVTMGPGTTETDARTIASTLGQSVTERGVKNLHIITVPHGTDIQGVTPNSVLGRVMELNRQLAIQATELQKRCEAYEQQLTPKTPNGSMN